MGAMDSAPVSSVPQERQRGLDRRFFHLLRWELRAMRGQKRMTVWLVLAVINLAGASLSWWAAGLPQYGSPLHILAMIVLITTPLRDGAANLGQMTFGYMLLRFTTYFFIALAKLILPAIAAGSVGNDRQSGRLQELQMMPVTARARYMAKVLAAALPFLIPPLALFLLFFGVCIGEGVPVLEIGRLCAECVGQVLLAAFVAVTCSALFASPWMARLAAYVVLWMMLPSCWLAVLITMGVLPARLMASQWYRWWQPLVAVGTGFAILCALQAAFTILGGVIAYGIGVRRLDPDRAGRRRRSQSSPGAV